MTEEQTTTLWLGAYRYYCGRTTYAVKEFCVLLIATWHYLPKETQLVIIRDLEREFKEDDAARARDTENTRHFRRLGHDMDRAEWEQVRALWKENSNW